MTGSASQAELCDSVGYLIANFMLSYMLRWQTPLL